MAITRPQTHHCSVVHETVRICLTTKSPVGMKNRSTLFVKCDQDECQYVDRNALPCQLTLSMFTREIEEREERARLRRDGS